MDHRSRVEAELARIMQPVARRWRLGVDRAMERFGLSDATGWVLLHVGRLGDGVKQTDLAAALDISGGSLVRLIDQLEKAGLVERRADEGDRRANGLFATAAGRDLLGQVETDLRELRRRMFDGIAGADLDATLRVLQQLDARVVAERDAAR